MEQIHKNLGKLLWEKVGLIRSEEGLSQVQEQIRALRQEFWADALVPGNSNYKNQELEKAGRVADFLELGELMAIDALQRKESCGCHFRVEYQTKDQEAQRNDEEFSHVSAWQLIEDSKFLWKDHQEKLSFEKVKPSQRNYK